MMMSSERAQIKGEGLRSPTGPEMSAAKAEVDVGWGGGAAPQSGGGELAAANAQRCCVCVAPG